MEGIIKDLCEMVNEAVDEKTDTVLEDEAVGVQSVDCLGKQGLEEGQDEGQNEVETDSGIGIDSNRDEENLEEDLAWDTDRDGMGYWMQEFDNILKEYEPVTKKMSKLKKKLGKPKTLLVAGGGVAAFGLALAGVVAGKKSRSRSVIRTLPVKSQPERNEEPSPAPVAQEKRNPPPVPWPFFYFR
ncbi:hypothetical protein [Desulforamulus putei]|uniref:Uncharacterized protein n=1 Tax=Desulforamulus putei DSM 12395 TaxID=1121429 RepID=A0A1M4VRP8_9FIRM|nr:hypothetical protein [Desulforamulus putei]SHE71706.1 hypothetical protein SAMN02745133_00973 [Desulforamulus putei DSM 12395]